MVRKLFLALTLIFGAATSSFAADSPPIRPEGPIEQLRSYEIFDHNKKAFHDRFRDHALRIMARHGFQIERMWEAKVGDQTRFVYLLNWANRAAMERQWKAFLADPEWIEIKRVTRASHGDLVGQIDDFVLSPVPYDVK